MLADLSLRSGHVAWWGPEDGQTDGRAPISTVPDTPVQSSGRMDLQLVHAAITTTSAIIDPARHRPPYCTCCRYVADSIDTRCIENWSTSASLKSNQNRTSLKLPRGAMCASAIYALAALSISTISVKRLNTRRFVDKTSKNAVVFHVLLQ